MGLRACLKHALRLFHNNVTIQKSLFSTVFRKKDFYFSNLFIFEHLL